MFVIKHRLNISNYLFRALCSLCICILPVVFPAATTSAELSEEPSLDEVKDTMKRATRFMVEKVSHRGGYVWSYLPDFSRRWGELEARETMIWIQPPGTATMGHVFLDAYHATGDEYYYAAAEQVAGAIIWAQHPAGGWNYVADFGGEASLRDWYSTIGVWRSSIIITAMLPLMMAERRKRPNSCCVYITKNLILPIVRPLIKQSALCSTANTLLVVGRSAIHFAMNIHVTGSFITHRSLHLMMMSRRKILISY